MTIVQLIEVALRDGLQNEPRLISAEKKVALVDLLSRPGLAQILCASFVSPNWDLQMAGRGDVLRSKTRNPNVCYTALTPIGLG